MGRNENVKRNGQIINKGSCEILAYTRRTR